MSEATRCNYCSLQALRRLANRERKAVALMPAPDGGLYVHVHAWGEAIDTRKWDDGNPQIRAWFMELTDECVC